MGPNSRFLLGDFTVTHNTKLLDKIRQTNVQEGEAGGITQQIGATYFPMDAIKIKTAMMHKDEPRHLNPFGMLRQRKTPFIVALNKIDRLFDWKTYPDYPTRDTLKLQAPHVINEFNDRVKKFRLTSHVPSELECTVLEVKVIEGLGTTIDVVLSNGVLNEGDRICVCGLNGPIVTTVRALLTPQPMRELRVKSAYVHNKSVKASLGIKISAADLDKAIAGSRLLVIGEDDDEDEIRDDVMGDLTNLMSSIDKSEKDIIRTSVMLERAPEYAQLLAFDVPIDKDAAELATEMEQKRKDAAPMAVFPCVLKMINGAVFNKRSPLIGVDVIEGTLKVGTPLCVVNKEARLLALSSTINQKWKSKGDPAVAVRIEGAAYETPKAYGRHFTEANEIYAQVTRASIDVLKTTFRKDMSRDDWALIIKLKRTFVLNKCNWYLRCQFQDISVYNNFQYCSA
ncbi:hypothetical protein BSLG_005612 [Batrachochytrium salamandrivorans]|nr:hypothetical protein BSLG_005612 [Batrachochytrium salamandrivorans]